MLPVIDLTDLDTDNGRRRLRDATHDVGFFYLIGHGVDPRLIERVQSAARAFFALPAPAKQAVGMIHSPHFRGYNRLGGELTNGVTDWREQIDIGIDREPIDGAFIVNIGELLEVATNGYLRATLHRVVTPIGAPEQLSIPYFFSPALDAVIPQVPLPPELATKARGIERDPDNPLYATYGENTWKSRTRAHPDVFARWYTDEANARA